MKFFTPALLDRFGSPDDAVADAAQHEWELAAAGYRARLDALRPTLPARFRDLLDQVPLHDARVASWAAAETRFTIVLIPAAPPAQPIRLTYSVADGAARRATLTDPDGARPSPAGDASPAACYWQYDEVDGVEGAAPRSFAHTILFSDGRELEIPFTDFNWEVVSLPNGPAHRPPAGAGAASA